MKRVMINAGSESGKSTLARALGDANGLPVYHMHQIHHMRGWQPRPDSDLNCPEEFNGEPLAFWKSIWDTRHSHRNRLQRLVNENPYLEVVHLKNQKAVGDFYAQIGQNPRDY